MPCLRPCCQIFDGRRLCPEHWPRRPDSQMQSICGYGENREETAALVRLRSLASASSVVSALNVPRPWTVKVFLVVFSGSGHLASAMARTLGGLCLLWDTTLGPEYDLMNPSKRCMIISWIRGGLVYAAHLGTPCNCFSRADETAGGGGAEHESP